jgi:hypothetical protein
MLITNTFLTSNSTKSYGTRSYDDLTCRSTNVVYDLECNLYACWRNKREAEYTNVTYIHQKNKKYQKRRKEIIFA